jgi:GGDEF domain-containing protein
MISIKKFLEQRRPDPGNNSLLDAALQAGRLLLDAMATHVVCGREADVKAFARMMKGLQRTMRKPDSALDLLEVSSAAAEAMETYARQTTDHIQAQNRQMHEMLAMLTDTVADISGQTDLSVARLQSIEQQIERASALDDMGALSISLQSCLAELREASAQQKKISTTTEQRLRRQIDTAQKGMAAPPISLPDYADIEPEPEAGSDGADAAVTSYVAVFKLQRADHIALRFGDQVRHQMLALISQSLKAVLEPKDRLLRWKGTSFVMFLETTATIQEVRAKLAEAVAATGQHYIEVGKKSALLSVGVDWTVFPQSQCASLDAVFTEVDSFLAGKAPIQSWRGEHVS